MLSGEKRPFSIVLPPPNVTGNLHVGHALDHTLMDILARWHRMSGDEVLWLPGMDHAGIATQTLVERQLAVDGKTKHDFGRDLFVQKVWDWKQRVRRRDPRPDEAARRFRRLEPRALHPGRRPLRRPCRPSSSSCSTTG